MWIFSKYSFYALIIWVIWSKIIKETFVWIYLKNQGVVFMSEFPPITDIVKFAIESLNNPTIVPFYKTLKEHNGTSLPDFSGLNLLGTTKVIVNKVEILEEI